MPDIMLSAEKTAAHYLVKGRGHDSETRYSVQRDT